MTYEEIIGEAVKNRDRPHPTIPGLRERYYYRGAWMLPEHLTPKGSPGTARGFPVAANLSMQLCLSGHGRTRVRERPASE
jgi:hypothetical protein